MGQNGSTADGENPQTPPEVEVSRRRQDYLHRLGIQKNKNTPCAPLPKVENYIEEEPGDAAGGGGRSRSRRASSSSGDQGDEAEDGDSDKDWEMNILDIKNKKDFRIDFLRRLSYEKVWVPNAQQSPKHQTVIIFDWDDTLLCTSFLNLRHDQELPPVVATYVAEIQNAVIKLLELAMRLGHTFIITNAMNGWVEYSAARWVPELLPVLQKVRVISARGRFEPQFPGEVSKWKIHAFLEVQRQLDSQIITNLISLGDSNFEMEAVQVMGREFQQALIKTIKFRENPSPEELLKQLQLVTQKFEKIVENARNLKIGLERKWVGGAQQG